MGISSVINIGLDAWFAAGMNLGVARAGVTAIWWSIPVGWLLADVTGVWMYWKGKRR